jgi:hypothetical protein
MMNSFARRILDFSLPLRDLAVYAAGCFVFMRGFRVVAMGQERPDARSSMRADGRSAMPMAGISVALFLLAFVASEAAATVVALRH